MQKQNLHYFERHIPVQGHDLKLLSELGGRVLPRDLWDAVGGMTAEKEMLERRLVHAARATAARRALRRRAPARRRALRASRDRQDDVRQGDRLATRVAVRGGLPQSRLAADPAGLAGALRETFEKISELERAVVFIDEVEEIASHRQGDPPSPTQGVTNELLKIIPAFRDQSDRLLICATNFIRALDSAFLRHGRFDYVIPIGLPDAEARAAIWARYIPAGSVGVDLESLVTMTGGFSPADIEFAARKASQSALENAVYAGDSDAEGPTLDDYIAAIAATRATVSAETAAEYLEDIESVGRL